MGPKKKQKHKYVYLGAQPILNQNHQGLGPKFRKFGPKFMKLGVQTLKVLVSNRCHLLKEKLKYVA
jgi:hypothetical protein